MCLAIPGKIMEIASGGDETNKPGKVSFGGILREVNLCFLDDIKPGDYVLVHVGVALSKVDEKEALETLRYLEQMDELDSELNPGGEEADTGNETP